uniref:Uncharacterized protein n=1 Tax=Cannabis sativa TaxID=3483 RepID=A0A803QRV5_CANSA
VLYLDRPTQCIPSPITESRVEIWIASATLECSSEFSPKSLLEFGFEIEAR